MNFHSNEDFSRFNCTTNDTGPTTGTLESHISSRTTFSCGPHHTSHVWEQNDSECIQSEGWSSMDIQLLNDDHEKAILSDLYKTCGSESTTLSAFSFISEYICSNNIDIWPGELPNMSKIDAQFCFAEPNIGDKRYFRASSTHKQIYSKCVRVLESIVTRNKQILLVLREKQSTNKT